MNFSIIIVNFNTFDLTRNCINSIFNNFNQNDFEVIVIDNNSSDGSVKKLRDYFGPKIKLIANKKNRGFGAANNQGAKIAQGKYLFFLNSDTVTTNNILGSIKKKFESDSGIGIISPKLLTSDNQEQAFIYGKFPSLINLFFVRIIDNKNNENIDWVSGAALIIRRNIFQLINGFDKSFFMYFEDIDLCKRVRDLGYKAVYLDSVSLIHLGGRSFNFSQQQKKYYYESQDLFFRKHYGLLKTLIMKIIRFPYKFIILMFKK